MDDAYATQSEFQAILRDDDSQLLASLDELTRLAEDDVDSTAALWAAFEAGLLRHLRADEELLIPRFELADPAEAARLRGEHLILRQLAHELDGQLHDHTVDRDKLRRLRELLHAQFQCKEDTLYHWADRVLRPQNKSLVVDRLRTSSSPVAAALSVP